MLKHLSVNHRQRLSEYLMNLLIQTIAYDNASKSATSKASDCYYCKQQFPHIASTAILNHHVPQIEFVLDALKLSCLQFHLIQLKFVPEYLVILLFAPDASLVILSV